MMRHLLETTLFAGAVWLLARALRRHGARLRHALWMGASVKFLIPFGVLVSLGSRILPVNLSPMPAPQMRFTMVDTVPALPYAIAFRGIPASSNLLPEILWIAWFCGFAAMLLRWGIRWRATARRVAAGTPWNAGFDLPLPARSSACAVEPGVFGIFRPVLLVPRGIEERLPAEQLRAIVVHELCHARHRDNLAAAVHMMVEAIFWFHPLVWWLGARLVEERERACDEEVLQMGSDRAIYAQSILNVCSFCLESPSPCCSAISGADLKQRIRNIMTGRAGIDLEPGKKLLLVSLGAAAVALPLAFGLMHPTKLRAQTAAPLRFDVASVKVSDRKFSVIFPERSGGNIHWTADLWYVLGYAYRLQPWRISGPIPANDHIYAIDATTDPNATEDQVRLMFQSLLIDRFGMHVHRETREVEGYALTMSRNGLKMTEAKDGEVPPLPEWFRGQEDAAVLEGKVVASIQSGAMAALTGRRATMLQLTEGLQRVLRVPVLDDTGLTGKYYFALPFAPPERTAESDLPDLPAAIQQLGLKLEKRKSAVEMLVVDRMEKTPTEN